jgi:arylformamidase
MRYMNASATILTLVEEQSRRQNVAMVNSPSHPLLFAAIESGDLDLLRRLLDEGADPNAFVLFKEDDPKSRLPALYHAAVAPHERAAEMVALLLERGAEPNDGESIYHAAELDRRDVLEVLVRGGADVSGRHEHWNNTPLYFLAGYHRHDEKRHAATRGMRWLLEHGADPNVTSSEARETPLHKFASEGREPEALAMLLDFGAQVDARRADGKSAYALAVRRGAAASADLLVARGAASDCSPEDSFLGAVWRADEGAARALLSADPSLASALSREGEWAGTPLHHAAWTGDVGATRLMLALGAAFDVQDRAFDSTPLGWAIHGSVACRRDDAAYLEVVSLLLGAGAVVGPVGNDASPAVASFLRDHQAPVSKATVRDASDGADLGEPIELVDLSHVIEHGMVTYKGLPAPLVCDFLTREASRAIYAPGTEFHIGRIDLVANTGTYVDSPFHRFAGGADMADLPLERLAELPAVLVRVSEFESRAIGPGAFATTNVAGRAVLVHTGWARHFRTDRYFEGHPFLSEDAAIALRERGAIFVGIDSFNIDDIADQRRPVHTTLLAAGIPICEHLRGLEQLPLAGFRFSAVPVKVRGLGSFPVRAYAAIPRRSAART